MPFSQKDLFSRKVEFSVPRFAWVFLVIPLLIAATFLPLPMHTIAIKQPVSTRLTHRPDLTQALEVKGSLIVRSDNDIITEVIFTIASTRGDPVNVAHGALTINYRDSNQQLTNLSWSSRFQGEHDQDNLLEEKELVQLTIPLTGVLKIKLEPGTSFVIEVTSTKGNTLSIQRTLPTELDQINDLN